MQTQNTSARHDDPARNPPADRACPGPGWDDHAGVADYLANAGASPERSVFRYSSSSGEITATDGAASREKIIRVEAAPVLDPDREEPEPSRSCTTSVILRNQNRAPSAASRSLRS